MDGIILQLDFFLKKPKFWGNSGAVVAATPLCIINHIHNVSVWTEYAPPINLNQQNIMYIYYIYSHR